jgi:hypothetical protein
MNGHEVATEIKLVKPELVIILLSGSDVPTQALALVDAFVPKMEASQRLLPRIADLAAAVKRRSPVERAASTKIGDNTRPDRHDHWAPFGVRDIEPRCFPG